MIVVVNRLPTPDSLRTYIGEVQCDNEFGFKFLLGGGDRWERQSTALVVVRRSPPAVFVDACKMDLVASNQAKRSVLMDVPLCFCACREALV